MNKRKRYLPSILAFSIATALGSGTFASTPKAADEDKSQQITLRGSFSALMQKTFRKTQETTLRGSFSGLVQNTLRKAQESSQPRESTTLRTPKSKPRIRVVARNGVPVKPKPEDSRPVIKRTPGVIESRRGDEPRQRERQSVLKTPSQSLADTNWSRRLGRHSSRSSDQTRLPPSQAITAPEPIRRGAVSEQELSRSVLLSKWLDKAKRRSAWAAYEEEPPKSKRRDSRRQSPREEIVAAQAKTERSASMNARDRATTYADEWSNAEQQTAWADNADEPGMELISSITLPEQQHNSTIESDRTRALKRNSTARMTTPAQIQLPKPKQPQGFGASLLARQSAHSQAPVNIAPPRSVGKAPQQIAPQQIAPQLQAQMRQQPLPRQWLPDLEVTPGERLARMRPQPPMPQRTIAQNMPWQSTAPEQWQYAPSNTQLPNNYQRPQHRASAYVMPNQIQLPHSQPMPPQQVINHAPANASGAAHSWSLAGGVTNIAPPPIANPVATPAPEIVPVLEQGRWPKPQYTAGNRLAPELPNFNDESTWQDTNLTSLQVQVQQGRQHLNEYRRPPPVTPKDIYQLASAQKSPAAGYHSGRHSEKQSAPRRSGVQQSYPQGSNSADRFLQHVSEPLTSYTPAPQNLQRVSHHRTMNAPTNAGAAGIGTERSSLQQMLNASANSLSIQWAVSTDSAVIHQLQRRYPLLSNATVVRFKSVGEIWYLLLTGIYPDRSSAKAALDSRQYQAMAKQLKPWMRPLDGLKSLKLITNNYVNNEQQQPDKKVLPQGEYTIQWMESESHQQLLEARNRHAQLANAEIVMVSRTQGMRYFLIQGRFAGFEAVESALLAPRFSSLVHQLNPKPRPMASLRHRTQMIYADGTPNAGHTKNRKTGA